jgi:hypothetical protein
MPRVPAISVRTRIRLQAHIAAVQAELLGRFLVWPDGFEVRCSELRAFGSADAGRLRASRFWRARTGPVTTKVAIANRPWSRINVLPFRLVHAAFRWGKTGIG